MIQLCPGKLKSPRGQFLISDSVALVGRRLLCPTFTVSGRHLFFSVTLMPFPSMKINVSNSGFVAISRPNSVSAMRGLTL